MYKVQSFGLVIWLNLLHIMLSFAEDNDQADVIKHCTNSTNSSSCCLTYEQVYESLTKNESSFNISDALYPEGAKPSFLVRVNVFGPIKTSNSIPAKFTWSIHCLYASVPEWLLQILSVGSIVVTPRRQELNIQIPAFCCNVSDDKRRRFLRRVQYQLQDLAVSPSIRDPSVNTAECVIRGHKPYFETTERSIHIRVMLWLSMVFAICSGLLLAVFMQVVQERSRKNKTVAKAIRVSFYGLSIISILVILVAFGFSICHLFCYKLKILEFTIILSLLILFTVLEFFYIPLSWGANPVTYIFCWLIIGIRINPTWGLTITLCVISVSAAVTYAAYLFLDLIHPNGNSYGTNGAGTNGGSSQDNSNGTAANSFVMGVINCCCCCCCCCFRHPNRQSNGANGTGTNGENGQDNSNDTAANSSVMGTINCCCRCCYRLRNGNNNDFNGAGTNGNSGQDNTNIHLNSTNGRITNNSHAQHSRVKAIIFCVAGCLAVLFLFLIVSLAGHASSGKEMALDEVLKTTSLYFITAFVGWVVLNINRPDSSQLSVQNARPGVQHSVQNAPHGFQPSVQNPPHGFQHSVQNAPRGFQPSVQNPPHGFQHSVQNAPRGFQPPVRNALPASSERSSRLKEKRKTTKRRKEGDRRFSTSTC